MTEFTIQFISYGVGGSVDCFAESEAHTLKWFERNYGGDYMVMRICPAN